MDNEKQFGPKCIVCNHKDPADEFCSEGWFQIDISKNPGPIKLIWVCPDCICKTRVYIELEQQLTKATKRIEELEEENISCSMQLAETKKPHCIKCGESSGHDFRGWMELKYGFYLCGSCILKGQAVKDLLERKAKEDQAVG